MGCGESKHVATGNTISRKNSRAASKRTETSETIKETSKPDSNASLLVKEAGKNVDQASGADNSRAVADGKNIAESTELKKENVDEISGRSEYCSPREEAGKESSSNGNAKPADALQDKKLSEETKEETLDEKELAEETKMETKKETVENKVLAKETKEESVKEIKLAEESKEETVQEIKPAEETKEETAEETKEKTVQEIKPAEETKEETKLAEEIKEDIVEDKKLAEDAKAETVEDKKLAEQKKEETGNGEPETVKEENLVKETETAETTEAKASTPVQKEKSQQVQQLRI